MAIGTDRYASRADTLLFFVCVALSIAALSLPDQWRDPVAQGLRQSILAPFLFLQRQTELLAAARYRYDAVVAQRDSSSLAATFLPELRSENARLRSLLGLSPRLGGGDVSAGIRPPPPDGAARARPLPLRRRRRAARFVITGGDLPARAAQRERPPAQPAGTERTSRRRLRIGGNPASARAHEPAQLHRLSGKAGGR